MADASPRVTVRRFLVAILLACAAGVPCFAAAPVVTDLRAERLDSRVLVSLRLEGGLDPARLEEIEAGIETTVRYRLRLMRGRAGLPDTELAAVDVESSVRRDALSRQYTLTRKAGGETVEKRMTADGVEMQKFLTSLERVPLADAQVIAKPDECYVRARAELGLTWRFYLIPWPLTTEWARAALPADDGQDAPGAR
jgi:hypothetical protein